MKCEMCGKEHDGKYGSGRFCSVKCARGFSTKEKRKSINERVSLKLAGGLTLQQRIQRKNAKKHASYLRKKEALSILELSSRTVRKILKRMNLGCSSCGWHVPTVACDLHHIVPKSAGGTDDHTNLALICPNCHRLAHSGLIEASSLVSFYDLVGDKWKEYYFTKKAPAPPKTNSRS